jgi:endonuclease YncB( thermonuclease family)
MPKSVSNRPSWNVLRWCLVLGSVGGAVGVVVPGAALAQGSLDMDAGNKAPAAVAGPGGLDMDVNPSKPVVNTAPGVAGSRDRIQDGARIGSVVPVQEANEPASGQTPVVGSPVVATAPELPEPVSLDHPTVIDTAKLAAGAKSVPLFGIIGQQGEPAQQLQAFLASTDGHLTCPSQTATDFVCLLSDGTDLAAVALINGAARTRDDAPEAYREQEVQAQAARRGIWSSLPPPPEKITHPVVRDTATLFANGKPYVLDGLMGLGGPYPPQLQSYIVANGDSLSCQPQPVAGSYICVLNDGTDIAKVALVNGAARVSADAPDSYRVQQLEALNNRRGYWLNPPADVVAATMSYAPPADCCAFVAGDDGGDGIAYVAGAPTAVIEGETVFLVLAGAAGWGYYDHFHHWRGAPSRYRSHLERFHPEGRGLRGYRNEAALHREGPYGGAHAGFGGHGGVGPYAGRPGGAAPFAGRPGGGAPYAGHPGAAPYAGRPGGGAAPYAGRPGGAPFAGGHPGGAPASFGGRPGMAPGGMHPGAMAGGGGFVRPNPGASSFHPAGMAAAPRMAAAPHVAAPAAHAAAATRHK